MRRIVFSALALVLTATAAEAAPGFGAPSAGAVAAKRGHAPLPTLIALANFFDLDFVDAKDPTADQRGKKNPGECDEAKKADAEKAAKDKAAGAAGPEPVYLAF